MLYRVYKKYVLSQFSGSVYRKTDIAFCSRYLTKNAVKPLSPCTVEGLTAAVAIFT